MTGILFVHGGDEFARTVFLGERRGYWSAALPVVLEKLGLLGFSTAGPEALADPETWQRHDVVLVARLPAGSWTPEAADAAASGRAGVLVEGPPPPQVADRLGLVGEPLDSHEGIITTVDTGLYEQASAFGYRPSGRIQLPTSSAVQRRDDLDWTELSAVPIAADQAAAWRARGWDAERLVQAGAERPAGLHAIADWLTDDSPERSPAIVRRDSLVACSFGLFAFLAQRHTSEPYEGAEHRGGSRAAGLESLLMAIVDMLHARAGATRARVMPWPAGVRWVRNVRHDFDRALSAQKVGEALDLHAEEGSAATWYWRSRHAETGALDKVAADPAHEVALHTELLWISAEDERRTLEHAVGHPILGTSAHGDPDCFRYQGAPNVLWADRQKLLYTELVQQAHFHPHRFPALAPGGEVRALDVICLPHHESLDRSTTPGDTHVERLRESVPGWIEAGGLLQILNHPDQNIPELFGFLAEMETDGRADWTAAQAAGWWRDTHVRDRLRVEPGEGSATITAQSDVHDLVVELRAPDGTTERRVLDLHAGVAADVLRDGRPEAEVLAERPAPEPRPRRSPRAADGATEEGDGSEASPPAWAEVEARFAEAVRRYMLQQGRDPNDPSAESTIRTNSTLVPRRAEDLLSLVRGLTAIEGIEGLRVLEIGSGWGPLATYYAVQHRPERMLGLDVREDFVDAARGATDGLGLDNLRFEAADMRELEHLEEGSFDLVFANNAFIYVPRRREQVGTLRAVHRLLAPGGHVVLFHANRWVWREPFTRSPAVHLLTPRLGRAAAAVTGAKHNIGRVRYVSPAEMRRQLRRAGFGDVRLGTPSRGAVVGGREARFARFYGMAGRRPPG